MTLPLAAPAPPSRLPPIVSAPMRPAASMLPEWSAEPPTTLPKTVAAVKFSALIEASTMSVRTISVGRLKTKVLWSEPPAACVEVPSLPSESTPRALAALASIWPRSPLTETTPSVLPCASMAPTLTKPSPPAAVCTAVMVTLVLMKVGLERSSFWSWKPPCVPAGTSVKFESVSVPAVVFTVTRSPSTSV